MFPACSGPLLAFVLRYSPFACASGYTTTLLCDSSFKNLLARGCDDAYKIKPCTGPGRPAGMALLGRVGPGAEKTRPVKCSTTSGSLLPPLTSASAARTSLLHHCTNSMSCPRSLARLMTRCGTILQKQEHAQQIVGMLEGRPVFLLSPAPVPAPQCAEPTVHAAGGSPSAPPVPYVCVSVEECAYPLSLAYARHNCRQHFHCVLEQVTDLDNATGFH